MLICRTSVVFHVVGFFLRQPLLSLSAHSPSVRSLINTHVFHLYNTKMKIIHTTRLNETAYHQKNVFGLNSSAIE